MKETIDEKLQSTGQQAMRSVMKSMPDDMVSMAWRSSLNERLIAEAAKTKKPNRFLILLRPALGLGLACMLAGVWFINSAHIGGTPRATRVAVSSGHLESALVSLHEQSEIGSEVAGVGLNPVETVSYSNPLAVGHHTSDWSQEDLDSL